MLLTGEWVNTNSGAHLLKLNPELGVLSDFLLVFAGELLQVGLEGLQLLRHLGENPKHVSKCRWLNAEEEKVFMRNKYMAVIDF